jgi:flagellar assembly protein FliH
VAKRLSRKLYSFKQPENQEVLGFRKGYLRGYKAGYERGYNEGMEKGFQSLAQIKDEWERDLELYSSELKGMYERLKGEEQEMQNQYLQAVENYKQKLEDELADIVSAAAENYLNNAIKEDRSLIKGLLEKELQRFTGESPVLVHVNKELADQVEELLQNSHSLSKRLNSIQVVKDEHVSFGIVVDSDEGEVDARVETLAKNLKALVESSLHDNPEDQLYQE